MPSNTNGVNASSEHITRTCHLLDEIRQCTDAFKSLGVLIASVNISDLCGDIQQGIDILFELCIEKQERATAEYLKYFDSSRTTARKNEVAE